MTAVISVHLVLVTFSEASRLVCGSWCLVFLPSTSSVPQVRSLVVDRFSLSLFVLASVSVAALLLIGLSFGFFTSALMSSAAVPAHLTFFAWGSTIGLLSQKHFAR